MSGVLIGCAVASVVLLAVGLFAVWRGPTVFDRMVAVSQATATVLVLVILLGFLAGRPSLFLDIALTYGLLTVVLPVALSAYVERSRWPGEARDDQRREPGP